MRSLNRTHALIIALSLVLLQQCRLAAAALTNITVDDSAWNNKTDTTLIKYEPGGAWMTKETCPYCSTYPFAASAEVYNGTWHAARSEGTVSPSASLSFNGVAIYVYCLMIPSTPWTSSSASNIAFYLDGKHVGSFNSTAFKAPSYGSSYPVYVNTSIPRGDHNFTLVSSGNGDGFQLTILDYIVYSSDSEESGNSTPTDDTPATSSTPTLVPAGATSPLASNSNSSSLHTAIIATATVIPTLIVIVCAFLVCRLRRRHGRQESWDEAAHTKRRSGPAAHTSASRPVPAPADAPATVAARESGCRFQAFFRRLLHSMCGLFTQKPLVVYVYHDEREPSSPLSSTSTGTQAAPLCPPPRSRPTSSAPSYYSSATPSPTTPLSPATEPPYAYASPLHDVAPTRMLSVLNPDVPHSASSLSSTPSPRSRSDQTSATDTLTTDRRTSFQTTTQSSENKSSSTSSAAVAPDRNSPSDERRRGRGRGRGRGGLGRGGGFMPGNVGGGAGVHEDANDGLPPPPYAAATAGLALERGDGQASEEDL